MSFPVHKMKNLLTFLMLASTPILHVNGSSLRGVRDLQNNFEQDETFDCNVYQLDGLNLQDEEHKEHQHMCVIEETATNAEKTFTFDGDFESKFGDIVADQTKMTIPREAVNGLTISSNHTGITFVEDSSRRERRLVGKMGKQKVLIVRVIGNDAAPAHWIKHLQDDFFSDENNLSTILSACSKQRLTIEQATGDLVRGGVINIKLNELITDKDYMSVSDSVHQKLYQIEELDYRTKIIIMPDVVDFKGAAAYAGLYGNTMWVKDKYASFPMVQVHEYGHLLGQHHSGTNEFTRNKNPYGDNNGHMGNALPWTDEGSHTCFNPAKMWYFKWFELRHIEINPTEKTFKNNLASHDDVIKNRAIQGDKMIVRVKGDNNEFFIMYNRAKGVNRDAVGDRDKIVVTKQNSESSVSWAQAGLDQGEEWTYNNFANSGKTLVVKNCFTSSFNGNDRAMILIYIRGLNDQQCSDGPSDFLPSSPTVSPTKAPTKAPTRAPTKAPVSSCLDKEGWYDNGGPQYNCEWYAKSANYCRLFGHKFENFDTTANTACCTCKQ